MMKHDHKLLGACLLTNMDKILQSVQHNNTQHAKITRICTTKSITMENILHKFYMVVQADQELLLNKGLKGAASIHTNDLAPTPHRMHHALTFQTPFANIDI